MIITNQFHYGGGDTITVGGTLFNQATGEFILSGPNDMATLGGLVNAGLVEVLNGSTLLVNGNLDNFGTVQVDPSTLTVTRLPTKLAALFRSLPVTYSTPAV